MKKLLIFVMVISAILLSSCTVTDPYPEDAYFGDIYSHGILIIPGVVGDMTKAVYDPANIVQQLVGISAAQSLTNKQLTMNNADPIKWKTAGGVAQDTINLLGSNILQITNPSGSVQILGGDINLNYNIDNDIYLWGGTKGSGRELVLYSGYATAGSILRDSPTLHMAASYWDGAAAVGWSGTILHDMQTAGATPKSQLKFSINSAPILRLENNNGVIKTFSDGILDMTTNYIINLADPINAQDAATKNYVGTTATRYVSGVLVAGNANAIGFAWHDTESQDILIIKVTIEVTVSGGTVGSHLDVGIADDAVGTNRGTEFFNDILLNNVGIYDSASAADGGNQVKYVLCQDSVSVTDGWVVGQILDANAAALVGKYYIEFVYR